MAKAFVAVLTIASLATTAQGAVIDARPAPSDGFDLASLVDGADHVLASVEAAPRAPGDPFGSGAVAFAGGDAATRRAQPAARSDAAYRNADAAVREPLPEPATWLMMILGFFGLSFAVRRRSGGTGERVRFS